MSRNATNGGYVEAVCQVHFGMKNGKFLYTSYLCYRGC